MYKLTIPYSAIMKLADPLEISYILRKEHSGNILYYENDEFNNQIIFKLRTINEDHWLLKVLGDYELEEIE